MTLRLSATALLAMLAVAGCGQQEGRQQGLFVGSYAFTAIECNGGAGPAALTARIRPPRSWTLTSEDGWKARSVHREADCAITVDYSYAYPEAGTLRMAGAGTVGCLPSAAACEPLSTALFGAQVCGVANTDGATTWTYAVIPDAAGGTVTLTAPGMTNCERFGLAEPFSYTLTRL
jgi:hypothetical protein